ncbi:histidine phosphatase family protein [Patescibacteria group bacterium]|nr:histidine phosphatase family protein [Patescibacteria group bacterium]
MKNQHTIYLLRHCEVEEQYDGVFRGGKLDCGLSEKGKTDSRQHVDFLVNNGVELVITSGMQRTDYIGNKLSEKRVAHTIQPLFAEIDFGFWDGRTEEEVQQQFPKEYREYRLCWQEKRGEDIVIPGGETMREVLERVGKGWGQTKPELAPVSAIVLHSVSMTCLLSYILNKPIKEVPYTELGGMHEIALVKNRVSLLL